MSDAAANPAEPIRLEYQPTDTEGNPIGKKTVIIGKDWEEVSRKQVEVNIQAVRGYHQLKTATRTPVTKVTPKQITADEEFQAAVELNDPAKARKGLRTLIDAEYGLSSRVSQLDAQTDLMRRSNAALAFLRAHVHDYYVCEANNNLLDSYIKDNSLDYTSGNYEIAFAACADQLAQSPAPAAPPAQPAPPANPPRRIQSATPDLQPGALSGQPSKRAQGPTKADYLKMARENPDEYKRHMTNPVLRARLDKVLAA